MKNLSQRNYRAASMLAAAGRMVAVAVLGTSLVACALVPREQLGEFAGSFEASREAGLLVYERLIAPIASVEATHSDVPYLATLGPAELRASVCEARFAGLASLTARCNAFAAATAYNEALLALADGAPAQATLARLDMAFGAIGALAGAAAVTPVVEVLQAPALGALKSILGEALELADRVRLKEKLDEGAPIMAELIAALQEDAGRVHTVARAYYAKQLTDIENRALDAFEPVVTLVARRAPPDNADTQTLFEAASARVDRLIGRPEPAINPPRLALLLTADGTPLTAADVAALTRAVVPLEVAYASFDATAAAWMPLRDSIAAYATMLDGLKDALAALVAASDNPFSAGGSTAQIAETIGSIREQGQFIRRQLDD